VTIPIQSASSSKQELEKSPRGFGKPIRPSENKQPHQNIKAGEKRKLRIRDDTTVPLKSSSRRPMPAVLHTDLEKGKAYKDKLFNGRKKEKITTTNNLSRLIQNAEQEKLRVYKENNLFAGFLYSEFDVLIFCF